jgi:hypothetical protein
MLGIRFACHGENRYTRTFGPFDWVEQEAGRLVPHVFQEGYDETLRFFAWSVAGWYVLGTDTGPEYDGRTYTTCSLVPWEGGLSFVNEPVRP